MWNLPIEKPNKTQSAISVQYDGQKGIAIVASAEDIKQQLLIKSAVIFNDDPNIRFPANLSVIRPKTSRPTTFDIPMAESSIAASFGVALWSETLEKDYNLLFLNC